MGLPGAVAVPDAPGTGIDAGLAWHYGDPLGEQRAAERGVILLDRWNADSLLVRGADRLTWLHSLCTQHVEALGTDGAAEALWLSARGHLEHWADVAALDGAVRLVTEPGGAPPLLAFLTSMVFWSEVEPVDTSDEVAVLTVAGVEPAALVPDALGVPAPAPGRARGLTDGPAGGGWLRAFDDRVDIVLPRGVVGAVAQRLVAAGATPAGTWAAAARRIAGRRPRFGLDNDERTIPNETPWLHSAVHLDKGCYRGQETVARIDNLGAPPRRLVLLNLDGSGDNLPAPGDAVVTAEGRTVGRLGTVAQHWEDGPIALALVKRTIGSDVPLRAGDVDAAVDPGDEPITTRAQTIDRSAFFRFDRA